MGRLQDKIIIVTGGARGIGAAFCKTIAAEGAIVIVSDVRDGIGTVQEIETAGGRATFIACDVASAKSTTDLVEEVVKRHGRIDAVVNNAAIFANLKRQKFFEIDEKEWDDVMAVNVRGPFLLCKAVAPIMMRQKSGKIVNIASGTVFKGQTGITHYVASKGAIVALTRCVARELGDYNINVNAIAPGFTMSEGVLANPDMNSGGFNATVNSRAFKREQQPEDLTGTLVFLCSPDSDFMTGQTLVVDGGSVMH
ncbi:MULTISPECIES: glucose 1-dehydrogenase [unclassified Beijerinckia]|uniref:SDR family NAD(P)-dependent oxidoreductase n=1 Tax=unclassified Beijerinckia TaxID=2638183 RepID=UPI00089ADBF7|nr:MULTISPECIES: glucose 1-dehydrogenase [unclassified Beijerinckia]MDH7794337.1 NAD(P)-dependent dehydrogenase (short-subunit alcohol dehydrogenase family) [Beijerinckia sp. GAS462]SEB59271.1 NAD(P)-dependent dehydrogenase, short-chain alcohol dehydrogenase family [Beijerinckia sp. 28-YEA-48]